MGKPYNFFLTHIIHYSYINPIAVTAVNIHIRDTQLERNLMYQKKEKKFNRPMLIKKNSSKYP